MTREELNELSIFALRELARRAGVASPTSKKKEELIVGILDITEGRAMPHIAKTKQGRPPKNYGYPFANFMMTENNTPTFAGTELRQVVPFTYTDDVQTLAGYVELVASSTPVLWVRQGYSFVCYPFSVLKVNELNLKTGDKVVVSAKEKDGVIVFDDVLNVNDTPISKYNPQRKDYLDFEHIDSNKNMEFKDEKFNKFNIQLGQNVYFYGNNNADNTNGVAELLNSSKVENKIYINVSLAEKNKSMMDKVDAELFTAFVTDKEENILRTVSLALERAKRLLETGEDVLVAVDDVQSVASVDAEGIPTTKNLITATKNAKDGGSISLFAVFKADGNYSVFEKLADKRFKVVGKEMFIVE
ncbi:MAG: hypothetical protein MJ149_01935 [Clostridia bacterium]|nr:hypothetical protein [Clostridia bacterium]